LVVIVLAVGYSTSAARSETTVNVCGRDVEQGNGTNLADALTIGGLIVFDCPHPRIRITREHAITRSTYIDGADRIELDAEDATQMFKVEGDEVWLSLRRLALRRADVVITGGVIELQGPMVAETQLRPAGISGTSGCAPAAAVIWARGARALQLARGSARSPRDSQPTVRSLSDVKICLKYG
jgi:hypothetical protein